jgi:hypothetical protein
MNELPAEVLRCQVDSLLDALLKVLDTRKDEDKAWIASHNARENSPDRRGGANEHKLHMAAIEAMKAAENEARLLLATLKRPNVI